MLYALFANAALTYLRQASRACPAAPVPDGLRHCRRGRWRWAGLSGSGFVDPGKPGVIRAFGSDVHPVSFAIQMLAAVLALEVIRAKTGRPLRAGHVALLALGAVALYLTFARTAWVMALMVLALLVWRRGTGYAKAWRLWRLRCRLRSSG